MPIKTYICRSKWPGILGQVRRSARSPATSAAHCLLQLALVHRGATFDVLLLGLRVQLVLRPAARTGSRAQSASATEEISRVDVRLLLSDSPDRARSLLTVRAAISSAMSSFIVLI